MIVKKTLGPWSITTRSASLYNVPRIGKKGRTFVLPWYKDDNNIIEHLLQVFGRWLLKPLMAHILQR